jgi:outer membrane protein TolC
MKSLLRLLIPFLWMGNGMLYAQEAGIEHVLRLSAQHYPSSAAGERYTEALQASLAAERAYLRPMLILNGQATWQSEVTSVDIGFPSDLPFNIDLDIPSPSKDQYRLSLDLTQRIYQGGSIHLQERAKELEYGIQQEQLRAGIDAWQQQAADCFYRIRLLETNKAILEAYLDDLKARKANVESAIRNGLADKISGDLLEAEVLTLEQQIDELAVANKAQRALMVLLTGDSSLLSLALQPTALPIDTTPDFRRPELSITDMYGLQLENTAELLRSSGLPSVTGFGQLGYGRPGLNMLDDAFSPYAMAGIRLSWMLWDNRMKKHRRDALFLQKEVTGLQMETTRKGLQGKAEVCLADIRNNESLIARDREILIYREAVSRGIASQFENGVITAAEYIRQKNEEVRTRLRLETHRVELEQALVNYRFIKGTW